MAGTQKDPVLVVLQLSGGTDYLNTVIPYNNRDKKTNLTMRRRSLGTGSVEVRARSQ
jgi:hypothetical protein